MRHDGSLLGLWILRTNEDRVTPCCQRREYISEAIAYEHAAPQVESELDTRAEQKTGTRLPTVTRIRGMCMSTPIS